MRRRLVVAMSLLVLASLVVSGLISLLVVQSRIRSQTRGELAREAHSLAQALEAQAVVANRADPAKALRNILATLTAPLRLEGSAVVALANNGGRPLVFDPAHPTAKPTLPKGLTLSELDPQDLLALRPVSGVAPNGLAYAAYPYRRSVLILGSNRLVTQAVVLTRATPSALDTAGTPFALSALCILVIAVVVAAGLGRRFVKPVRSVEQVTAAIASGDLEARVDLGAAGDPELQSLARSVNSMAQALEWARGAERQFLQNISHDLRTPLTSISGYAEAIEDGVADPASAARVIATEAGRLSRLVGDRFTFRLEPLDLSAAARSAATGLAPVALELGLQLSVEAPEEVLVHADQDRLAQVADNLVENALRFASRQVRLVVRAGEGTGVMWVDDDGPGIAPANLGRVFERLYAAPQGAGRHIGTGLGLAIVAELVQAMGGRVWAESPLKPGAGGTRMVIELPGAGPSG
jgi:signal transduction histidine kinase